VKTIEKQETLVKEESFALMRKGNTANLPRPLAAAHRVLSGLGSWVRRRAHRTRTRTQPRRRTHPAHRTGHHPTPRPTPRPTFPTQPKIFRVIRYIGGLAGQLCSKEVAHRIPSLAPEQANTDDPSQLLCDHWDTTREQAHIHHMAISAVRS
jgi:hypothetical protein